MRPSRWCRFRDCSAINWHHAATTWGELKEGYYRRLCAHYIGEARRQAKRAREAEEKCGSLRYFLSRPIDTFDDADEPILTNAEARELLEQVMRLKP